MKRCNRCGYKTDENLKFCPMCGYEMVELSAALNNFGNSKTNIIHCPSCGTENDSNVKFCPSCGTSLENTVNHQNVAVNQNPRFISSVKSDFANSEPMNQMGNVATSFRKDLNNSETINPVNSLSDTKKRNIIIITTAAVAVLVLFVIIISCIHTCDECGDVYFGSKNEISFWGESEDVCKDCYNDFYWF